MSAYFVLLVLFLPFFTIANTGISTNAIDCSVSPSLCPNATDSELYADHKARPPHPVGGLDPIHASGDILNTTRCYCASADWETSRSYGYHHILSYYNFHHEATYQINLSCTSSEVEKRPLPFHNYRFVPHCLRQLNGEKWCSSADSKGNLQDTFCYEFGPRDYYYFNRQKRGLPYNVAWRQSEVQTLIQCDAWCKSECGGMDVLDGEALTAVTDKAKGVGREALSAILSWSDTDDMCAGCS